MRRFPQLFLTALCLAVSTQFVGAAAQSEVALAQVAATAHLAYSWLSPARIVQLTGPGIVLIIRPGENLYEINDRVESTATAPRSNGDDIYVSSAFAAHIVQLARQASLRSATMSYDQQSFQARNSPIAEIRGTIVLNVQPLKGAEALLVTGTAPPSAPVLITLLATFSSDIPNVLVSRHDLWSGPDGKFQAVVPTGPDFIRGSFLKVLATSGPGVTSASAQILLGPPNPGVKVPWEQIPGGLWPGDGP
jgi:hypothetical protein